MPITVTALTLADENLSFGDVCPAFSDIFVIVGDKNCAKCAAKERCPIFDNAMTLEAYDKYGIQ